MCNFYRPADMSTLHEDIRRVIQLRLQHVSTEWWKHTYFIQNTAKATLWLVGGKDSGTGFHVDWAEAKNVAWAIDGQVRFKLVIAHDIHGIRRTLHMFWLFIVVKHECTDCARD